MRCVACGARYSGDNHHCDPKREKQIEDARRASEEVREAYPLKWYDRLSQGFQLMDLDGDD